MGGIQYRCVFGLLITNPQSKFRNLLSQNGGSNKVDSQDDESKMAAFRWRVKMLKMLKLRFLHYIDCLGIFGVADHESSIRHADVDTE